MAYSKKKNCQRYFRRLSNSNSLTTWKSNKKFLMDFQIRCNNFKFRNKIINSSECSVKKEKWLVLFFIWKDKVSFRELNWCFVSFILWRRDIFEIREERQEVIHFYPILIGGFWETCWQIVFEYLPIFCISFLSHQYDIK